MLSFIMLSVTSKFIVLYVIMLSVIKQDATFIQGSVDTSHCYNNYLIISKKESIVVVSIQKTDFILNHHMLIVAPRY